MRARFFDAAEPLLDRFGYGKTTVADLCKAAGVSKQTFYRLFRGKRDLCIQLVLHVWSARIHSWAATIEQQHTPLERLDSFLEAYRQMARDHLFLWVYAEDLDLMKSMQRELDRFRSTQHPGPLLRLFRDGIESGAFANRNPHRTSTLILAILDTFYFLYPRITGDPGPIENDRLADELRRFIVNGLLVPLAPEAS